MSITNETAQSHANDPAVCCCRFEAGTVVEAANLEDPAIFPDLVDSGLLEIPDNVLTIGQVLGAKLTQTLDALSPMTPDNVEDFKDDSSKEADIEEESDDAIEEKTNVDSSNAVNTSQSNLASGVIKIYIAEGKDIKLEFPVI
ncbi:sugar transporter [Peptostreptococcus equinus]|uniref:Sugar transporter n=1 Tax=Peptostreptococcus equinus TaxID=3003601 RepID=A0ABY7JN41_9FIRM|nr:sugar transporter [Peptostreptococcus sp. CBA3647]WAW14256.1 sugar transporter [Peptostreptococcus sp. CBA3647]